MATAAVVLVDDVTAEEEESFLLSLSSPTSQRVGVDDGETTITIRDTDSELMSIVYSIFDICYHYCSWCLCLWLHTHMHTQKAHIL